MLVDHHRMFGRVYLALCGKEGFERDEAVFSYFSVEQVCSTFHDDSGHINLGQIYGFCAIMDEQMATAQGKLAALTTTNEERSQAVAVFLFGAYMILVLGQEPDVVRSKFQLVTPLVFERQSKHSVLTEFQLHPDDGWEALHKAKSLEWVDFGPDGFDPDEYDHYDDPCNADLHVIVPNKIIALKGPAALPGGQQWHDTVEGSRTFSAEYSAEILHDFDVKLVVRLNQPNYCAETFEAQGIAVADLFLEDCTVPTSEEVVKFLLIVENVAGPVAVHCTSGRGRTGTLIALYLMKNFAFTARQAIAWLRIVRPGSVIGHQQHYVCTMEASMARLRGHPLSGRYAAPQDWAALPPPEGTAGVEHVYGTVRRIVGRVDAIQRRQSCPPDPSQNSSSLAGGLSGSQSMPQLQVQSESESPALGLDQSGRNEAAAGRGGGRQARHAAAQSGPAGAGPGLGRHSESDRYLLRSTSPGPAAGHDKPRARRKSQSEAQQSPARDPGPGPVASAAVLGGAGCRIS